MTVVQGHKGREEVGPCGWELEKLHLRLCHAEVHIRGDGRKEKNRKGLSEGPTAFSGRARAWRTCIPTSLYSDSDHRLRTQRHYWTIKGIYMPGKIQMPLSLPVTLFLWIKNP